MNKVYLYQHGGAGNHGCEAIVRSVTKIVGKKMNLISFRKKDDIKYGLESITESIEEVHYPHGITPERVFLLFTRHILRQNKYDYASLFKNIIRNNGDLFISIGGDLYCGKDTEMLSYVNKKLTRNNKSVLLGCSIEPGKLKQECVVEDLKRYDAIIARESITYNALVSHGITKQTVLCADPAFVLDIEACEMPIEFEEGNTVGLNISPLILNYSKNAELLKANFDRLIRFIIENTSYQIALIPHVVWSGVSDYDLLKEYYELYRHTNRICLVEDDSCTKLKYCISKCKLFMGARTHATIAAYSTCIPTVVFGYSVKSRGIATDIFGTTEDYILSIENVNSENDFIHSFEWLDNNSESIKQHLEDFIPDYKQSCYKIKETLKKISGELFND